MVRRQLRSPPYKFKTTTRTGRADEEEGPRVLMDPATEELLWLLKVGQLLLASARSSCIGATCVRARSGRRLKALLLTRVRW
jgi:hypothetical protein